MWDEVMEDPELCEFLDMMSTLPYTIRLLVMRIWFYQRKAEDYMHDLNGQTWRHYEMFEKGR